MTSNLNTLPTIGLRHLSEQTAAMRANLEFGKGLAAQMKQEVTEMTNRGIQDTKNLKKNTAAQVK